MPHGKQVSPDKNVNCQGTPIFTKLGDTNFYDFLWSQFIPFVFIPTAPTYSLRNPPPEANPKQWTGLFDFAVWYNALRNGYLYCTYSPVQPQNRFPKTRLQNRNQLS